jgi:hypothetical protein
MKNVVVLGSCRQDSLQKKYNVSKIKEEISYPHYSKEMVQVVSYCLNNDISEEETKETFRTPALYKRPLKWNLIYSTDIEEADVVFIEIASKLTYKIDDRYVHHILYDDNQHNKNTRSRVLLGESTDEELHEDIQLLQSMIQSPIIIVGHLVTKEGGKRHDLLETLRNICLEEKIQFIDPVQELRKRHDSLENMFVNEPKLAHYTDHGHNCILRVYEDYINELSQC